MAKRLLACLAVILWPLMAYGDCDPTLTNPAITTRVGFQQDQLNACNWGTDTNNNWTIADSSMAVQGQPNTFTAANTFNSGITIGAGQSVQFNDLTTHSISLGIPNPVTTGNYYLPSADGTNGQFLQTNGSGRWSFATIANGTGSSTLAVTTGTVGGFSTVRSSPTLVINANSSQFSVIPIAGATAYLSLLPSSVTLQGNTFNQASTLVQLNSSAQLPAIDGSLLTGIVITGVLPGGATSYWNAPSTSTFYDKYGASLSTLTVGAFTDSGLSAGQCVQTGAGGLLSTTGSSCGGGGSGSPGGTSTQIQYNNSGSFGGIPGSTVTATGPAISSVTIGNLTVSSIPSGVVLSTNGVLNTQGNLPYGYTYQRKFKQGTDESDAANIPISAIQAVYGSTNQVLGISGETNQWVSTTNMNDPLYYSQSVSLDNGQLLMISGYINNGPTKTNRCELYNAYTGTWTYTGSLNTPVAGTFAVKLLNGDVVIGGGETNSADDSTASEVYITTAGIWVNAGNMNDLTVNRPAVLLPNGFVLAAGGDNDAGDVQTAELFNPITRTWAYTGSMNETRTLFGLIALPNGKVLACGGRNTSGSLSHTCEIYDPATAVWTYTTSMIQSSAYEAGWSLINNNEVLAFGGSFGGVTVSSWTEVYRIDTAQWRTMGFMNTGRFDNGAYNNQQTLLPNGDVLAAGGAMNNSLKATATTEIYNHLTGNWANVGQLSTGTINGTVNLLPTGEVLYTGGNTNANVYLSSASLLVPISTEWKSIVAGSNVTITNSTGSITISASSSGGGGGGYAVQPATVTFLLNDGFTASTGTIATLQVTSNTILSGATFYQNGTQTITGPSIWTTSSVSTFSALNIIGPGNQAAGAGQTGALNVTYQITAGSETISGSQGTNIFNVNSGDSNFMSASINQTDTSNGTNGAALNVTNATPTNATHYGAIIGISGTSAGSNDTALKLNAAGGGTEQALLVTAGTVALTTTTVFGNVLITSNTVLPGTTFYQNGTAIINGVNSSSWLTTVPAVYRSGIIGQAWDGGGSALTTGTTYFLQTSTFTTTNLAGFTLMGLPSGSMSVFVSSSSVFNTSPVSICGVQCPQFTTATSSANYTLGGWTTSLPPSTFLYFYLNSATTVTNATLKIDYIKP